MSKSDGYVNLTKRMKGICMTDPTVQRFAAIVLLAIVILSGVRAIGAAAF